MKKDYTAKIFENSHSADWKKVIEKDLKGNPFESVISETLNRLTIAPYYTEEELPSESLNIENPLQDELPGLGSRHWINYAEIQVDEFVSANKKALQKLESGADGIVFHFDRHETVNWKALLQDIHLEYCGVAIKINQNEVAIAESLVAYLKEINAEDEKLSLYLYNDLFENHSNRGKCNFGELYTELEQLINACKPYPSIKCVHLNLGKFHNKGAAIINELALGLSQLVECLDQLTNKGLSISQIVKRFSIEIAVGSGFFQQIAKIKAFKALIHTLFEAYKEPLSPEDIHIFCTTSERNKSFLDIDVNILRNTSECFAAILGGANAVHVRPHDFRLPKQIETFERIALNTSIILREESHLNKVSDPTQGAYFIENLIEQTYSKVWEQFLNLENEGGFTDLWNSKHIHQLIKEDEHRERDLINRLKITKIGANKYPNFKQRIDFSSISLEKTANFNDFEAVYALKDIENLRLKVEHSIHKSSNDKRPSVTILAFGTDAVTKAKSNFASNFLGIAGIETEDELIIRSGEDLSIISKNIKSEIIVLCYSEFEPGMNKIWEDSSKMVLIAGKESKEEEWKKSGLYACIHRNVHALEFLTSFTDQLIATTI